MASQCRENRHGRVLRRSRAVRSRRLVLRRFREKNNSRLDPLANISARPFFVGVIYPEPTPFTKFPETPIPANVPPGFIAFAGDRVHALWATDYFTPMLNAGVPNVEMHIYGRGDHGVQPQEREVLQIGNREHRTATERFWC